MPSSELRHRINAKLYPAFERIWIAHTKRFFEPHQDTLMRLLQRFGPIVVSLHHTAHQEFEAMCPGFDYSEIPFIEHGPRKINRKEDVLATEKMNSLGIMRDHVRSLVYEIHDNIDIVEPDDYLSRVQLPSLVVALEIARLHYFDIDARRRQITDVKKDRIHKVRCRNHSIAGVPIGAVALENLVHSDIDSADLARYVTWAMTVFTHYKYIAYRLGYLNMNISYSTSLIPLLDENKNKVYAKPWCDYPNFSYVSVARAGAALASLSRFRGSREIDRFINAQDWKIKEMQMAQNAMKLLEDRQIAWQRQLYSSIFLSKHSDPTLLSVIEDAFKYDDNQTLFVEFLGIKTPSQLSKASREAKKRYFQTGHDAYQLLAETLYEMAVDSGLSGCEDFYDTQLHQFGKNTQSSFDPQNNFSLLRTLATHGLTDQTLSTSDHSFLTSAGITSVHIKQNPQRKDQFQLSLFVADSESQNQDEEFKIDCVYDIHDRSFSWSIIEDPFNDDEEKVREVSRAVQLVCLRALQSIKPTFIPNVELGPVVLKKETTKGRRRRPEERRTTIRQEIVGEHHENGSPETETVAIQKSIPHVILRGSIKKAISGLDSTIQRRIIRTIIRFNTRATGDELIHLEQPDDNKGQPRYRIRAGRYRIILEEVIEEKPNLRKFRVIRVLKRGDSDYNLSGLYDLTYR